MDAVLILLVILQYGLKLDGEILAHTDIHIHFPAGAVGKDGPSAGVTIATALVSLFSGRPVASDVAMTGEITLRGIVLPVLFLFFSFLMYFVLFVLSFNSCFMLILQVGGIKEKVLAAHRAGIRRVILPKKCEKDLVDIPSSIKVLKHVLISLKKFSPSFALVLVSITYQFSTTLYYHAYFLIFFFNLFLLQKDLFFIPVSHVDEVLQAAFDGGFHANVQLDQVRESLSSKL